MGVFTRSEIRLPTVCKRTNVQTPAGETPASEMCKLQLQLLQAIHKSKLSVTYSFSMQVGRFTLSLDVLPGVKMKDHGGRGSRKRRRARQRAERDTAFSVASTSEDSATLPIPAIPAKHS